MIQTDAFQPQNNQKRTKGFTLVEVIVVIVVIGILVTIASIYLPQAVKRSKAAVLATSMQQTRKALVAWHIDENWINWQTESELCFPHGAVSVSDNPKISQIIENDDPACPGDARLQKFLNKSDVPGQFIGNTRYDNDIVGLLDNCSGQYERTVNLQVAGSSQYFEYVNQIIDGDEADTKCGRVVDCSLFGSPAYTCIAYILSFDDDEVSSTLTNDGRIAKSDAKKLSNTLAVVPVDPASIRRYGSAATQRFL